MPLPSGAMTDVVVFEFLFMTAEWAMDCSAFFQAQHFMLGTTLAASLHERLFKFPDSVA